MPRTRIILYKDVDGRVPFIDWLRSQPDKVVAKCIVKLERLSEVGHEIRRPEADYLRDDIYELRINLKGQNYRILYFFHGREAVVVSHGLKKEAAIPPKEIDLAVARRTKYLSKPLERFALFPVHEVNDVHSDNQKTEETN